MTLEEQGFRFIWRNDEAKWVHSAEIAESDIDLTDFTDNELIKFIKERE